MKYPCPERLRIVAGIALLVCLLAACDPIPVKPADDALNAGGDEPQEKLIAYLPSGMTSPFYSQAAQSAAQYGEKFGMRLEAQAPPAETDFNGQAAIFEQFIARKVDGILLCAIDYSVLTPSVEKANEAGIPVIVFNSLTPFERGEIQGYVGYNQYKAGYALGEYTGKLLQGKGEVFVIRGVPGYHDTLRTNGYYDALKRFPDIRVVGEGTGNWVRDQSIQIATEALKAHPEIDLILGVNDEMAIGASIAARQLNREIYTLGIDGNPITMVEIENGNVTATYSAFPGKIGEVAMEQMRKVLAGEPIAKFLETPGVVVDSSNIEDYKTGSLWTPPVVAEGEVLSGN